MDGGSFLVVGLSMLAIWKVGSWKFNNVFKQMCCYAKGKNS